MRIVTLLPAATEMICALGLEEALVGRSHECDTPPSITNRPVVTSCELDDKCSSGQIDTAVRSLAQAGRPLYGVDAERLRGLRPDLVVAQELCDVCAVTPAQVQEAVQGLDPEPAVLRLEPGLLADVLRDIERLGEATGRHARARACREELEQRLDVIQRAATPHRPRVLFLEWLDPAFGAGHWNPELIRRAGGQDVLDTPPGEHSRVIDEATLDAVQPDLVFVAACGFTAERSRREWDALPDDHAVRRMYERSQARLVFADGNAYFNRPGPRLVDSLELLVEAVRQSVPPSILHTSLEDSR